MEAPSQNRKKDYRLTLCSTRTPARLRLPRIRYATLGQAAVSMAFGAETEAVRSSGMDQSTEFHRFVEGLLSNTPVPGAMWSDDRHTIRFPKRRPTGYDIEVTFDPTDRILSVETDRGYHHHVHIGEAAVLSEHLSRVFGLVRDMLSSHVRILETCNGSTARKWELQVLQNGQWVTESSTGLLLWNFLGRKTQREYSNDTLPPR